MARPTSMLLDADNDRPADNRQTEHWLLASPENCCFADILGSLAYAWSMQTVCSVSGIQQSQNFLLPCIHSSSILLQTHVFP